MAHTKTAEQISIIDAAVSGVNLIVDAGAGTGKTTTTRSTMKALAPRRGMYLTFNRDAAEDAKSSFPRNVKCSTVHGVAYGSHGRLYRPRMDASKRMTLSDTARVLGIREGWTFNKDVELGRNKIARHVMDTLRRFCYSADLDITHKHVPFVEGANRDQMRDFAGFIVPFAKKAWVDLMGLTGKLRFEHDHYLKLWAIGFDPKTGELHGPPMLNTDFLGVDEAQDTNPVFMGVIQAQTCQRILIGDRCQAIYGWRGAVDAMSAFPEWEHRVLSQSFRFGDRVAVEANKWLGYLDAPLRLQGFDQLDTQMDLLDEPDAVLCRTNAEAIGTAIHAQAQGTPVALAGGTDQIERFIKGAKDLMSRGETFHPDLSAFKSWTAVQEYVNEEGSGGGDLKVYVKLIDTYGIPVIEEAVDAIVPEPEAKLTVSTAHKAKGREWDKVRIANDFKEPQEKDELSPGEAMLAYVAVTRARKVLDRTGLAWIDHYLAAQ